MAQATKQTADVAASGLPGPSAEVLPLRGRDVALVLAAVAMWGVSFPLLKRGVEFLPPMALGASRNLLAGVLVGFSKRESAVQWSRTLSELRSGRARGQRSVSHPPKFPIALYFLAEFWASRVGLC